MVRRMFSTLCALTLNAVNFTDKLKVFITPEAAQTMAPTQRTRKLFTGICRFAFQSGGILSHDNGP